MTNGSSMNVKVLVRWSRRVALGTVLVAILFNSWALAGPAGEQVIRGSVQFDRNNGITTITASNGAIINYRSFNIGAQEAVRFIQPSATSRVLNRVRSNDPTRIDGSLTANGIVYLVNPAGVIFGAGSVVDAAGLYAAAGNMSNGDFAHSAGRFTALHGNVVNYGMINAQAVALLGRHVANHGSIVAPDGMVVLAAGKDVLLTNDSVNGRVHVRVEGAAGRKDKSDPGVENTGTIDAPRGQVSMGAGDMYAVAARNSGEIAAADVKIEGKSTVEVAGKIDVSSAEGKGGDVAITGKSVELNGAEIDASGAAGGGTIRIGGGYQGKDKSIHNAEYTFVSQDSVLRADATAAGDGGTIIVWANKATYVNGTFSVRGGPVGGDAGFLETSAKGSLTVAPATAVDLAAPAGTAGRWLLDPTDVVITGATSNMTGDPDWAPDGNPLQGTIDAAAIEAVLNGVGGGTVTISTASAAGSSGDIGFISGLNINLSDAGATTSTLTLNAAGNISLMAPITLVNSDNAGDVFNLNCNAVGGTLVSSAISNTAGSGKINFTSSGTGFNNTGGAITTTGGAVNINNTSGIIVAAAITTAGGSFTCSGTTFNNTGGAIATSGGAVSINNTGGVTVGAAINAGAGTVDIKGTGAGATSIDGAGLITTSNTLTLKATAAVGSLATPLATACTGTIIASSTNAGDIYIANTGNVTLGATSAAGSDVVITNVGTVDITGAVSAGTTGNVSISATGANNGITVNNTIHSGTTSGGVTLTATGGVTVNSSITTAGGAVVVSADSEGDGTGTFTIAAAPTITVGGDFGMTVTAADVAIGTAGGSDRIIAADNTVEFRHSVPGSPMYVGTAGAGWSLTSAEIFEIGAFNAAISAVTFGRSGTQSGDISVDDLSFTGGMAGFTGRTFTLNTTGAVNFTSTDSDLPNNSTLNVNAGTVGIDAVVTSGTTAASTSSITVTASGAVTFTGNGGLRARGDTAGVTIHAGTSGAGDITFSGAGADIRGNTVSLRAGSGGGVVAAIDVVTNTPDILDNDGGGAPAIFSFRQDAAITHANLPAKAQMDNAVPPSYTIQSDSGSISLSVDTKIVGAAVVVNGIAGGNTFQLAGGTANQAGSIVFNGGAGIDSLALDLTTIGTGMPSGGVTFTAGNGTDVITGGNVVTAWTLSGANAGSTGLVSFSGVDSIAGGTAADTVTGPAAGGTWTLTAANQCATPAGIAVTGIENLTGGAGNDDFVLNAAGSLSGTAAGGGGTNTVAYTGWAAVTVNLQTSTGSGLGGFSGIASFTGGGTAAFSVTGANAGGNWSVTGANALTAPGGTTFSGFGSITGGSGNDNFTIQAGGSLGGSIDGGLGTNTLTKAAGVNAWSIDGANSGTVTGVTGGWSNIASLIGGPAADTFTVAAGGSLSGTIDGTAGADTLSYAGYGAAVSINLQTGAATAIFGGLAGGIQHIAGVIGSGVAGSSLTVANIVNDWQITGGDSGTLNGGSFSGFTSLTGGTDDDTFTFAAGGSMSGTIDGGAGTNGLNYAGYGAAVNVDLATGAATAVNGGLAGGVSNIQGVVGSGVAGSSLTVANIPNAWAITVGGVTLNGAAVSGFTTLVGGSDDDTFTFADGATFAGTINGGLGNNSISFAAYTSAVAVNLQNASATGLNGGAAGGFSNITSFTGGSGANTLTGIDAGGTWNITASDAGTAPGGFSFTAFGNLVGGSGNDVFAFDNNVGVAGTINGGGGANTLSYAAYTAGHPVSVNLQTGAATNTGGVSGIQTFLGGAGSDSFTGPDADTIWLLSAASKQAGSTSFSSFENLNGGSGNDMLVLDFAGGSVFAGGLTFNGGGQTSGDAIVLQNGTFGTVTHVFANAHDGSISFDAITFNYTGLEPIADNLSATNRVFTFGNAGYAITLAPGAPNSIISSNASETVTFVNPTASIIINAGNGTNTITVTGAGPGFAGAIAVNGGTGTDTVIAADMPNVWTVTGANSGNLVNGLAATSFSFSAVENLTGGANSDTLVFNDGTSITGTFDGGAGANTISYALYNSAVTVNLQASTASHTGGFANVTGFTGGSASDTFVGLNAGGTWNISASNAGTAPVGYSFSSFENLTGGTGADTFALADGAGVTGTINGGMGANAISYAAYSTAVTVNLQTGAATNVGGLSNIGSFTGSGSADTLVGVNAGGTWNITGSATGTASDGTAFASFEKLVGGTGDDTFSFADAATVDSIDGGAGANAISWAAYTTGRNVTLTALGTAVGFAGQQGLLTFDNISSITGSATAANSLTGRNAIATWDLDGTNTYTSGGRTLDFANFAALVGGSAADTFVIGAAYTFPGSIDGGAGSDSIDWSAKAAARSVTLTATGATDGFAGTEVSVTGGFTNINGIVGSAAATDTLTGMNADAVWTIILAGNSYTVGGGFTLSFTGATTLNGGGQDDNFIIDFTGGSPLPAGGLTVNGGAHNIKDTLTLVNGAVATNVVHTFTGAAAGTVAIDARPVITYSNTEAVSDLVVAANRTLNLPAGAVAHNVMVAAGPVALDGISRYNESVGLTPLVDFANPTASLTINTGAGADSVQFAPDSLLAVRYAGAATVNALGSLTVNCVTGGDFTAVSVANLVTNGDISTNGGDISLSTTAGSIRIGGNLDSRHLLPAVGNAGDISIQVDRTAMTNVGVAPADDWRPNHLVVFGNGSGSIMVRADSGAVYGDISVNNSGVRPQTPSVATIIGDVAGGNLVFAGQNFTMGALEKMTSTGGVYITRDPLMATFMTRATLSDITAVGFMGIRATTIDFLVRAPALVVALDGTVVGDTGLNLIAGNLNVGAGPGGVLYDGAPGDPAPLPRATGGSPFGFGTFPGTIIATGPFTSVVLDDDANPPPLSLSGGVNRWGLDGVGMVGFIPTSIATALATALPTQKIDVNLEGGVDSSQREDLVRHLGIYTKEVTFEDLLQALMGARVIDDLPAGKAPGESQNPKDNKVSLDRIPGELARQALATYWALYWEKTTGDKGEPIHRSRAGEIRDLLEKAVADFKAANGGKFEAQAFWAWLKKEPGHEKARSTMVQLAKLFHQVELLGLGPIELSVSHGVLARSIKPRDLNLAELLNSLKVAAGTPAAAVAVTSGE